MTTAQSEELARAFARDGSAFVIESLLNEAAAEATTVEKRVAIAMESLEAMAEYQVDVACCLMLALWPIASELRMHDVCNAVDLWIWHNRSTAVIEHIKQLTASEFDPRLKRHLEGLLPPENPA